MYRFHLCHIRGVRDKNLAQVCLIAMAQNVHFLSGESIIHLYSLTYWKPLKVDLHLPSMAPSRDAKEKLEPGMLESKQRQQAKHTHVSNKMLI